MRSAGYSLALAVILESLMIDFNTVVEALRTKGIVTPEELAQAPARIEAAHAFRRCTLFPTDLGALRTIQTRLEEYLAPEYQRHFEDLTQGGQEEKSR
jgi:hypothetical protein